MSNNISSSYQSFKQSTLSTPLIASQQKLHTDDRNNGDYGGPNPSDPAFQAGIVLNKMAGKIYDMASNAYNAISGNIGVNKYSYTQKPKLYTPTEEARELEIVREEEVEIAREGQHSPYAGGSSGANTKKPTLHTPAEEIVERNIEDFSTQLIERAREGAVRAERVREAEASPYRGGSSSNNQKPKKYITREEANERFAEAWEQKREFLDNAKKSKLSTPIEEREERNREESNREAIEMRAENGRHRGGLIKRRSPLISKAQANNFLHR